MGTYCYYFLTCSICNYKSRIITIEGVNLAASRMSSRSSQYLYDFYILIYVLSCTGLLVARIKKPLLACILCLEAAVISRSGNIAAGINDATSSCLPLQPDTAASKGVAERGGSSGYRATNAGQGALIITVTTTRQYLCHHNNTTVSLSPQQVNNTTI